MSDDQKAKRRVYSWLLIVAVGGVIGTPSEPDWNLIRVGDILMLAGFAGAILKWTIVIPCAILGMVLITLFIHYPMNSGFFAVVLVMGAMIGTGFGVWLEKELAADE